MRDGLTLFNAMIFAQTVCLLRNPHKQDDVQAQYEAGVEDAMRVYETLMRATRRDRQPYSDSSICRRDAGTPQQ